MKQFLAVSFLAFATVFNSFSSPTNQPPTSAEQLRSEFEAALRAKDTNAIVSLIYWKDVSDKGKSFDTQEAADMVTHQIVGVQLESWPTNLPVENDFKGIHYKPNLQVIGMLKVDFADQQGGVGAHLPYGKIGDAFLMAATIEEPLAATPAK
jgi:hypothetical protein